MTVKTIPHSYNPLYLSLKDQISTENIIFKQKNDYYTTALTLTSEVCFKKSYIKDSTNDLIKMVTGLIKGTETLSYFKEAGLVLSLAKKYNIGGTVEIQKYLESCLKTVGSTSTPPQILGSVGYFLRVSKSCPNNFDVFQAALSNKLDGYISSGNLNAVVDISIGLNSLKSNQVDWIKRQVEAKLDSLALERISKLVILFSNEDSYISKLEELLSDNLGSATYPNIGFSIFEAQKIINSNIPNASLKNILIELKKVDSSWSKMITNMESEGITIDLAQLHKVPNFSPHQDIWSLLGLSLSGRAKTVQVSEKDYQGFLDYSGRTSKSYRNISILSFIALLMVAVLQTIYVYYLFDTKIVDLQDTAKNLSLQNYFLDIKSTYFIFINPWLQLGVALIWIPVLTWRLVIKGRLTFMSIILSWPVLLPFYEIAKNIKKRASD